MKNYLFTSESVTEGHPDKLCDLISDSILDELLKQDEDARVAVECLASNNNIMVAGQVTANAEIDIENIARQVIKQVGYDDEAIGLDYRTCNINVNITKQSYDITQGIQDGGAGDQGMMFGFACNETKSYLPLPIDIAHKLARQLTYVRKENIVKDLRPDGKTQVTVEYENGIPKYIDTIIISAQHNENIELDILRKEIIGKVINPIVNKKYLSDSTKIYINKMGKFTIGGPIGDTGLTGRKIIVDTYGGYSRHGRRSFFW